MADAKAPATKPKPEKKRAQPGDFERQVEQIRRDIKIVRDNLAAAESSLNISGPSGHVNADCTLAKSEDMPHN